MDGERYPLLVLPLAEFEYEIAVFFLIFILADMGAAYMSVIFSVALASEDEM